MTQAALALADGTIFRGTSVGADGTAVGEVVFNTAMSGYQEILTDPSYAGQIITMTSTHIGNYGVAEADDQAPTPMCSGLVVRSLSRTADTGWRTDRGLADYLAAHEIVALTNVDTRRLTRHIRDAGAMAGAMGLGVGVEELVRRARDRGSMSGRNLASVVTTAQPYEIAAMGRRKGHVVAVDLGIKRDIVTQLALRGFDVSVVPATTPTADILAHEPDGVLLSNGPGDPEPVQAVVRTVADLLGKVPLFGICLGHQILGLALGARTYKLPFGHHGGNHPVRDLADGAVAVTSQNHGFAVDLWSLADASPPAQTGLPSVAWLPAQVDARFGRVVPTHQNLNDGTLEGMACIDVPAFSVQFHPEAAPGPHDALGLFDDFAALMKAA